MSGNNVVITVSVNNNTRTGFNAVNQGLAGIQTQVNATNQAVTSFWRDSSGRMRDAQGRFVSSGSGIVNSLQGITGAASGAAGSIGGGGSAGGGLSGAMSGLTAIVGLSALPALGALVPMIAGAGLAAVTAKTAFSGVGEAVALAGVDTEKYNEALKKMGPAQREFTKAIVSAKKEFSGFSKEIQKIVLPSFTQALKDAAPLISTVKGGMRDMARVFAETGKEFGKLFGSKKFKKDLQDNFENGTGFIRKILLSLDDFTASLVKFGAKSKPTIDAFGNGMSGLLSKGLPGFFDGLSKGIEGSAKMFDGLFDGLNDVLPAFGRLSGSLANTFGPALGSVFRFMGDLASKISDALIPALDILAPAFGSAADSMDKANGALDPLIKALGKGLEFAARVAVVPLKNLYDTFTVIFPLMQDLGKYIAGPFVSSFMEMTGAGDKVNGLNGKLTDLSNWAATHKAEIREAFRQISQVIMDMVIIGLQQLPNLIAGFRLMATGILTGLDAIISGAALAFGWIPGIGDKLKAANREFDGFKNKFIEGLGTAQGKAEEFAGSVTPKLEQNKLQLNIDNWTAQINDAKVQLADKNLPPGKRAKLTADIKDWTAKRENAEAQLRNMKAQKTAKLKADKKDFDSKLNAVKGAKMPTKTARIKGDSGGFWGAVRGIAGRVVGSAVINLVPGGSLLSKIGGMFAHGGIVGQAATGGARGGLTLVGERGPELVDLAPGSRVRSNEDSRRIASSSPSSGQPIVVNLHLNGRVLAQELIDPLRGEVRRRGGLVQSVLGK
jgi:hypothetical protein